MFGQRILALVPHPDDEVVACAAAIGRAQAKGAQIFALYLTHGCLARDVLWYWQRKRYDKIVARRRREAEQVAQLLGITPVVWSPRPARHLWQNLPTVKYEIETAIAAHNIDQLWLPAYEGGNPDHDALNALGQCFQEQGLIPSPQAGGELLKHPPVLEFAEYNYFKGKVNSHAFPYPNGGERIIEMTDAERGLKCKALQLYASEKLNLNYVRTDRECYRPLADYDYTKPPHPGKLWYARFQWVPFRHPRVDFTNPADVSKAIEKMGLNDGQ